jgi:hypothetical protein
VEKENRMWVIIVLSGGYAVLAAVVAVWSARVCFHPETTPAVRTVAYKIFRTAWTTGATSAVGGCVTGAVKLHEAGFI